MTTTAFFSESGRFFGLYRMTLRRSRGYLYLLSALVAVFYPLQYALEAFKPLRTDAVTSIYQLYGFAENYTILTGLILTPIVLLAPLVLALAFNSYMHSKKAADVYHALPVTRGTLLLVHAATAMTIIAVPLAGSTLLVGVMQAIRFGPDPSHLAFLLLDLFGWLVCTFAIYAVTTFVCVCTGTVFDSFIFSGALLVAPPVVSWIGLALADSFLFGWGGGGIRVPGYLSPVTLAAMRILDGMTYGSERGAIAVKGGVALLVWLAAGALVLLAARRLYRMRRTEIAETTASRGVLQLIVKLFGVAVCGGMAGLFTYLVQDPERAAPYMVMWTAIAGFLSYMVLESVLSRGFKSLVRRLPAGAAMTAAVTLLTLIPITGGLGYEQRVPDASGVSAVEISYHGADGEQSSVMRVKPFSNPAALQTEYIGYVLLKEPQGIDRVLSFHQRIVEQGEQYSDSWLEDAPDDPYVYGYTNITYRLKNGRTVKRSYYGASVSAFLELLPLETQPEFLAQTQPAFFNRGSDVTSWTISNAYKSKYVQKSWPAADSQALFDAMQADLLARTAEEIARPQGSLIANIQFLADLPPEGAERFASSGVFAVTDKMPNTLRFLREKGVLDEIALPPARCIAAGAFADTAFMGGSGAYIQTYNAVGSTENYAEFKALVDELQQPADTAAPADSAAGQTQSLDSSNVSLFEDPDDIQAFLQAAVPRWVYGEPVAYVTLWFDDASIGSVLVPLERLPDDLRARVWRPYD
ncbi:hypothetical protein [Anaerotruncus colihominis]|uniref:Uncharacterized protein n=1 Tax=Anaerotruncus colihominis TaxID=169435 RepID=A0A845T777_9FIRM|nr:hypothetical protein [Anaerotruncus colihominis]MCR2024944.1 hypothetical protein [Anaerotruncus colihominis]NDO40211.1 hypothetical protein [Anaerotruncus colihominis]